MHACMHACMYVCVYVCRYVYVIMIIYDMGMFTIMKGWRGYHWREAVISGS